MEWNHWSLSYFSHVSIFQEDDFIWALQLQQEEYIMLGIRPSGKAHGSWSHGLLSFGSLYPFLWSRIPARGWCYPQWTGLPISNIVIKIIPHWQSQKSISQVTLDTVKLTENTSHTVTRPPFSKNKHYCRALCDLPRTEVLVQRERQELTALS